MIIFYSIFILFSIVTILICINKNDNSIENINITEAHIVNFSISKFNMVHSDLNITNKIQVYKHLMLYRLKIFFEYEIDFVNYKGHMYFPDKQYYDYAQIINIKKYCQKKTRLLLFYNETDPSNYWID